MMIRLFAMLFGCAFILAFIARTPFVTIPLTLNMFLWIPLGFLFTALAFWKGRQVVTTSAPANAASGA